MVVSGRSQRSWERSSRRSLGVAHGGSGEGRLGLLLFALGGGLGIVLVMPILDGTIREIHAPGGWTLFLSSATGLLGTYLALLMVLMAARVPVLERVAGRGTVMGWHRHLSVWTLLLIFAHVLLSVVAYSMVAHVGAVHELVALTSTYPFMWEATVAVVIMIAVGGISIPQARERISRESWWLVHLLIYVALIISFFHEVVLGPDFVGHPQAQITWSVAWILAGLAVVTFRVGLPWVRSRRHALRVVEVAPAASGALTVVLAGRDLDRLGFMGGQFFEWRFLTPGRWWQAHPFTVSGRLGRDRVRLTVDRVGDFTEGLVSLPIGTTVAFEGPYGSLTARARRHRMALLIAGGVGATAIRSLLDDIPAEAEPVVVMRARSREHLLLLDEIEEMAEQRRGRVYLLLGPRDQVALQTIAETVADFRERDIFIAGSEGFVNTLSAILHQLGARKASIHVEAYEI